MTLSMFIGIVLLVYALFIIMMSVCFLSKVIGGEMAYRLYTLLPEGRVFPSRPVRLHQSSVVYDSSSAPAQGQALDKANHQPLDLPLPAPQGMPDPVHEPEVVI